MAEIDNPPPDLDYEGDAMDLYIEATKHVVNFRRRGPEIRFAVSPGPVTVLNADQAEVIARQLFAAALAARAAGRG